MLMLLMSSPYWNTKPLLAILLGRTAGFIASLGGCRTCNVEATTHCVREKRDEHCETETRRALPELGGVGHGN